MAGYIQQSLQPGETVEYSGRVSRIAVLLRPAIMVLIAIVGLGIAGSKSNSNNPSTTASIVDFLVAIDLLGALIGLVRAYIFLKSSEYIVTDRRVIGKYGFIRRSVVDVLLTQVSGVTLSQSIPGRLFRFGTVWILAGGARRSLIYMKAPLKFQSAVYARLEESRLLKGTAAYTLDVRMVPGEPAPATAVPQAPHFPPPPTPSATPAQWAPDPYGKAALRYWDGQSWTEHVSGQQPATGGHVSSGQQPATDGLWA